MRNTVMLVLPTVLSGVLLVTSCRTNDPEPTGPDAFVGTYSMESECADDDFELVVKRDEDENDQIIFKDFFEGEDVTAEVEGNTFTLEEFSFDFENEDDGQVYEVNFSGKGKIEGDVLTFEYTLSYQGREIQTCEAEGKRE